MALEDYKDIVGAFAGFVTICHIFSGVFLCRNIYQKGSTKNFPPTMFIGGLILGVLFYQYGLIIKDKTMGIVNLIGFLINCCYLAFYALWSDRDSKMNFISSLLKGLIFIMGIIVYAQLEDPEKLRFRFGMITTVYMFLFIGSPLLSLKKVIKTKSTESLPFPIILSASIVSASWLLYGIVIQNGFIIFQKTVLLILGAIQLSLFVIYPSKAKPASKKE